MKLEIRIFKDYYDVLEPNRHHGQLVKWVATNNCFFSKKVFINQEFFFDPKFASVGGSDQVIFQKIK